MVSAACDRSPIKRLTTTKNTGRNSTPSRVAPTMPHYPGADGMAAVGAGAGGNGQRQHTENRGDGGHEDGPEAQPASLLRGLQQAQALQPQQPVGEPDDQDGILGRKADDRAFQSTVS